MTVRSKARTFATLAATTIFAFPPVTSANTYSNVTVRGNQFLRGDDILMTCAITPEETFHDADIAAMRSCLMATGQFADVDFVPEGDTMVVEVEELNTRPGRVEFGLQFDSEVGVIGSLYFERYNLFPDTFGSVELRFSDEFAGLNASLYHVDAFGMTNFDVGLDISISEANFDDQSYDHRNVSIEPFVARQLTERDRVEIGLGYRSDVVTDVDIGASPVIVGEAGSKREAYLRLSYSHDAARWTFDVEQFFFGIGSGNVISQSHIGADTAIPVSQNGLDLVLSAKGGHVADLSGASPRISERFFIGGSTMRGFEPRGLGPRHGGDFLGGNSYFVASAALEQSIGDLFGTDARIGGFIDVGSTWGLDNTLGGIIDDGQKWRAAAGLTLTLTIGNVPVSLYVAEPIKKEPFDKEQNVGLSISTRF